MDSGAGLGRLVGPPGRRSVRVAGAAAVGATAARKLPPKPPAVAAVRTESPLQMETDMARHVNKVAYVAHQWRPVCCETSNDR